MNHVTLLLAYSMIVSYEAVLEGWRFCFILIGDLDLVDFKVNNLVVKVDTALLTK